jgi:hypothetical protein
MKKIVAAAASFLLVSSPDAAAQTCRGTAPVGTTAPIYVGGGFGVNRGATLVVGTVAGGSNRAFIAADVGGVSYDYGPDEIAYFLARISAGGQIAAVADRRVMVCPTVSVTNEFANDSFGADAENWGLNIAAGATVGASLGEGRVQIVPTVGLFGARSRLRLKSRYYDTAILTETYGYAVVGVGIVLHGRFSLTPQVFLPFAIEGGTNGFSLMFALSFPK